MPRIHPADEQATLDLATVHHNGKRTRVADLILLSALSLILLGFGVAIYLLPQKSYSEQENRTLQTMPELSMSVLTDNGFSHDIADFYADQFPTRSAFVGLKTLSEISLLRYENNGVLIGKNGYLIKRLEYGESEYDNIRKNLTAVASFSDTLDIPVTLSIAPRGIDVLTDYLPDYYATDRADAAWTVTLEAAERLGLSPVIFTEELRGSASVGTEVWFRTDHHWTPRGAYLAYMLLYDELGYYPMPLPMHFESLTAETLDAPFYGTTYSSAGMPWARADEMTFYHIPEEERYLCEIVDTGKSFYGFYDRTYLETKDKYGALIGGNNGHVRITDTAHPDKPTLLIVKDSFSHAVIPYLAQHFTLEILDLRYWRGSVSTLADECNAEQVLILLGLDSLASAPTLELLKYGMK
jgi:hypothetical protein